MNISKPNNLGVQSNLDAGKDWMKQDLFYRMLHPQKCIVCTFSDKQGDIIESVYGYAHQECLQDQYAEEESRSKDQDGGNNDFGYDDIAQEKGSHLHG